MRRFAFTLLLGSTVANVTLSAQRVFAQTGPAAPGNTAAQTAPQVQTPVRAQTAAGTLDSFGGNGQAPPAAQSAAGLQGQNGVDQTLLPDLSGRGVGAASFGAPIGGTNFTSFGTRGAMLGQGAAMTGMNAMNQMGGSGFGSATPWYNPGNLAGSIPMGLGAYGAGYGGAGYGPTEGPGMYLQGLGSAILAQSHATRKNEESLSRDLDNRLKWQRTYYALRNQYTVHITERQEHEHAIRDKWLANGGMHGPPRLSENQFNRVTGTIAWPSALKGDEFAELRVDIEKTLLDRAASSTLADANNDLHRLTENMLNGLKAQIDHIQPADYIAARKFLDSLSAEARYALR